MTDKRASVRYAAPPVGSLRWQAPQPPTGNGSLVSAVEQPPLCPQTGGYGLPEVYGFNSSLGDEDCLFLNIYAAPNASNLPVFVWIRKKSFLCLQGSFVLSFEFYTIALHHIMNYEPRMITNTGVLFSRRRRLRSLRSDI